MWERVDTERDPLAWRCRIEALMADSFSPDANICLSARITNEWGHLNNWVLHGRECSSKGSSVHAGGSNVCNYCKNLHAIASWISWVRSKWYNDKIDGILFYFTWATKLCKPWKTSLTTKWTRYQTFKRSERKQNSSILTPLHIKLWHSIVILQLLPL